MPSSDDLRGAELRPDVPQKPEPNFFDFGDVYFNCSRCGNDERIQSGVKDGMQFVLPTSDQHEWRLVCPKCDNMMRIFFRESDEETKEKAKEQIRLEEKAAKKKAEDEALEKAQKEIENESKKKDKKKRSTKGNSKDTTGVDQFDREGKPTLEIVD